MVVGCAEKYFICILLKNLAHCQHNSLLFVIGAETGVA